MSVELTINKGHDDKVLSISNQTLQNLCSETGKDVDLSGVGGTLDPYAIISTLVNSPRFYNEGMRQEIYDLALLAVSLDTNLVFFL